MQNGRRAQAWILKKLFEGEPKLSDFLLEEQTLGDIKDGGNNSINYFVDILKNII